MLNHGLSDRELETIRQILAPYAQQIVRVDLFGSRATGAYQPYSDIDLVLHGVRDPAVIDRLWTLFSESNLPLKVDIKSYDLTEYPPLKAHMDAVAKTLFTQAEL